LKKKGQLGRWPRTKGQGGRVLVIVCPTCNKDYKIPDDKIAKARARARCKNCGEVMVIDPGGAVWTKRAEVAANGSPHAASPQGDVEPRIPMDHGVFMDFPELQGISPEKVAFKEILVPNKRGGYRNRKNKFKVKILMAVSEVLDKIIKEGERVKRIGKGTAFYPVEVIFGNGWLTMMYNQYAILATNQRILLINVNSRMKGTTHYLFQVLYEDIKKVKRGILFSSMILDRIKSKRRVLTQMKRYISKEMKGFITEQKSNVKREPEAVLECLCPSCFVPLEKGLTGCPSCEAAFKTAKKATWRSLLLPGLGDFYLGHRALGALELMGSLVVWTYALLLIYGGQKDGLFVAMVVLLFYNCTDAIVTYFMAKKGYMLA
jgi:predicted Zn finger-like uncharacterized protein